MIVSRIIFILILTLIFCNDGQGPLFTETLSSSDFFKGQEIKIDVQALDADGIEEIILYYRFSKKDAYKNTTMNFDVGYTGNIPGFEVVSKKIEYYFLGIDSFGNQNEYPENGETNPLTASILSYTNDENPEYQVDMITPLENSKSQNISIIIISLYSDNDAIQKDDIQIILDNIDITKNCNISSDLITYVPTDKFIYGSHELILKLNKKNESYFIKNFIFEIEKKTPKSKNILYQWKEKITYSGYVDYISDYDKFNYGNSEMVQPESRPLDIHRINFNFKAKYKLIDIKSSILFNTHLIDVDAKLSKKDKQPIDRMKIGIRIPYGTFNLGDYSTAFSDLTLKGTRVRGLHALIEWKSFKIFYIRGKTKELIQAEHKDIQEPSNIDDIPGFWINEDGNNPIFHYYKKGTPSRNLRAIRTEFNLGGRIKLGLSGLTSYDLNDIHITYPESESYYLFTGNSVGGGDLSLYFNNKRTWITAESAVSITNDISEDNINNFLINDMNLNLTKNQQWTIGAMENLLGYPITVDALTGRGEGRGLSIPNPIDPETGDQTKIDFNYLKRVFKEGTYKVNTIREIY